MKARALLQLLRRPPLRYAIVRSHGSHRILRSQSGYPQLVFSFHDSLTVGGTMVRKILVRDVGLGEAEALWLVQTGELP